VLVPKERLQTYTHKAFFNNFLFTQQLTTLCRNKATRAVTCKVIRLQLNTFICQEIKKQMADCSFPFYIAHGSLSREWNERVDPESQERSSPAKPWKPAAI